MPPKHILILGGTGLARQAADFLVVQGHDVTTSLAGVTRKPQLPKGKLRVGGFGGADGLLTYLQANRFDLVIDGTHAFAAQMSANAHAACRIAGIKLVRLEAPEWVPQAGDDWRVVASVADAVRALPAAAKVAVTVGRKEVRLFFTRSDLSGVARMIEPAEGPVPPQWQVLLERPPFTVAAETDLLRSAAVDFLVSKNAGGARPAKLDAAAALGIPVVMVQRPRKPEAKTVASVEDLLLLI